MNLPQPSLRHAQTTEADRDQRLDRWLAMTFPDVSRTRFQSLIAEGCVTVEDHIVRDPGHRLQPGQSVAVTFPPSRPAEPQAENLPLDIVYEDSALIVIDKPAGLVVHPGAGHERGTLVNALIAHCGESLSGIGGVKRPGIVHRLDKDTSGLLVVAKTDAAHKGLSRQFASHGRDGELERAYLAFIWGVPARARGTVAARLARSTANRTKITVTTALKGREAITHYETLERFGDVASLVKCRLETGRTHQIRVHMAHLGHPLLADPLYGKGFLTSASKLPEASRSQLAKLGRQALHATLLGFVHPVNTRKMLFESPLPRDLSDLLAALREPETTNARNITVTKK